MGKLLILAGVLIAGLAFFHPKAHGSVPYPVDNGGLVYQYLNRAADLNYHGRSYRIDGICLSACTIYLSVKNVCVTRRARIGFHSAFDGKLWDEQRVYRQSPEGNRDMFNAYPPRLQQWVHRNNALAQRYFKYISGHYAIRYLGFRECSRGH